MTPFDKLELFCVRYFPRIAESAMALMVIALAVWLADERAAALVIVPPSVPLKVYIVYMLGVGVAHLLGIFMPLLHELAGRRGYERLSRRLFNSFIWRLTCCVAAIAGWGWYAGVMSRMQWGAWLFAVPFSLLETAAFIRLWGLWDADRSRKSPTADDSQRGLGDDGRADPDSSVRSSPPNQGAARGRLRTVRG